MATTLGFNRGDQRFVKMVSGRVFRSARGSTKAQALKQYREWHERLFGDSGASEIAEAQAMVDAACVALASVGETWEGASPDLVGQLLEAAMSNSKTLPDSLATVIDQFSEFKRGKVTAGRLRNIRLHLDNFRSGVGNNSIESIDRHQFNIWHSTLSTLSPAYGKDCLGTVRSFFRWLCDQEIITTIPRFVIASSGNIKLLPVKKEALSKEQVAFALESTTGLLHTAILLMLNTAMTQIDIAELDWSQIDLTNKTLTRKRTKHKHRVGSNCPVVTYALWDRLASLLEQLPNRSGLVLTDAAGLPLVSGRRDVLASLYVGSELPQSLKEYRKFGATVIGSSQYRAWRELYLANAGGLTDTAYDRTTVLPAEVTEFIRDSLEPNQGSPL